MSNPCGGQSYLVELHRSQIYDDDAAEERSKGKAKKILEPNLALKERKKLKRLQEIEANVEGSKIVPGKKRRNNDKVTKSTLIWRKMSHFSTILKN